MYWSSKLFLAGFYAPSCLICSIEAPHFQNIYVMQGKLYMIMEICRIIDRIFKEHLDGMYASQTIDWSFNFYVD